MLPALVVVWAAVTDMVPPLIVRFPATLFMPETVVSPAELEISTMPLEVIGAPLVMVDELESPTVPALMAPEPVLTVEAALEITTSLEAVIVALVLLNDLDAPVE
jgi:hypothetical protein